MQLSSFVSPDTDSDPTSHTGTQPDISVIFFTHLKYTVLALNETSVNKNLKISQETIHFNIRHWVLFFEEK